MNQNQERTQNRKDPQRPNLIKPRVRHHLHAQPLPGLGSEQRSPQADAHPEYNHRAPRNT